MATCCSIIPTSFCWYAAGSPCSLANLAAMTAGMSPAWTGSRADLPPPTPTSRTTSAFESLGSLPMRPGKPAGRRTRDLNALAADANRHGDICCLVGAVQGPGGRRSPAVGAAIRRRRRRRRKRGLAPRARGGELRHPLLCCRLRLKPHGGVGGGQGGRGCRRLLRLPQLRVLGRLADLGPAGVLLLLLGPPLLLHPARHPRQLRAHVLHHSARGLRSRRRRQQGRAARLLRHRGARHVAVARGRAI
mmetsp:Transcript_23339/g.76228  ORF Transcript_23339/g.76228 Transcript_23339/m.76228 type:complete len:247 (-) Transcript_23339:153-893(-)